MIIYCCILHCAVNVFLYGIIPLGEYDYFDILIPQNSFFLSQSIVLLTDD